MPDRNQDAELAEKNRRDRLNYPAYFNTTYYGRVKDQALLPCVAA